MKKLINIILLVILSQVAIAQEETIKSGELFIMNKLTGKSIKIGNPISKLCEFDSKLIQSDTLDLTVESDDYYIRHTFDNIVIYESVRGYISSFTTRSMQIAIEVNGSFSISPGEHMNNLAAIFPNKIKNATITNRGIERIEYLGVWLHFYGFHKPQNKYIIYYDSAIALLFNPETKILEEIFYWIRP